MALPQRERIYSPAKSEVPHFYARRPFACDAASTERYEKLDPEIVERVEVSFPLEKVSKE